MTALIGWLAAALVVGVILGAYVAHRICDRAMAGAILAALRDGHIDEDAIRALVAEMRRPWWRWGR